MPLAVHKRYTQSHAERARTRSVSDSRNSSIHSYASPQERNNTGPTYACGIGQSGRFRLSLQPRNPNGPVLRANPYPEVTDLFCRLPLPTLFYRPEAFHLGDLLRIWVRLCTKFTHLSPRFSRAWRKRIEWHKTCATFSGRYPYLRANRFQGSHFSLKPLNKKRQLSPKLAPTSLGSFVLPHK